MLLQLLKAEKNNKLKIM